MNIAPMPLQAPRLNAFANRQQPRFGNAALASRNVSGFLKRMDFESMAMSTIPQIQVVYGLCILSRVAAAAQRSKNEVRETITRDSLGYGFWFFATPVVQKLFLKAFPPKNVSRVLIQQKTEAPAGKGLMGAIKRLNFKLNPMSRWEIPSSRQLEDRMHQALNYLKEEGISESSKMYQSKEAVFKQLLKWRRLSTFTGIAMTIALLGVGINLVNIAITRKKVAEGQVGL